MTIMNLSFKTIRRCYGRAFVALCLFLFFSSCKKLVEVDPPGNQLVSTNIFRDDASAAAALTGLYQRLNLEGVAAGKTSVSLLAGLSADELVNFDPGNAGFQEFYVNALKPENQNLLTLWSQLYNYIYSVNKALEGIGQSKELTPAISRQLQGEALFLRAFCYFYLTNLFGDIPLVTASDYEINQQAARTSSTEIYQQIITDLLAAKELLPGEYRNPNGSVTAERVRPNKFAAIALLARVYLYTKDYQKSEQEATEILQNKAVYDTVPLNSVFLKNSKEAIWQLESVIPFLNTYDGYTFILTNGPNSFDNPVYLSDHLLNSFNPADQRLAAWVGNSNGYKFPFKYKIGVDQNVTEYPMVLRLGEQYLIRAEARAEQQNLAGAEADINVIRRRAGLQDTTANTVEDMRGIIVKERQTELFTEWGHRWLDIKRMNGLSNPSKSLADEIMPAVCQDKGGIWSPDWKLYPLPRTEMVNAPNLKPQNPGYN
jgi:hypothetical protein